MTISEQVGRRIFDPGETSNLLAAGQGYVYRGPLTALAGGGRPGATPLVYGMNEIGVVATANDSVILPVAAPGSWVDVANADAADSVQMFATGSDTINVTAGATGVALAAGKNAHLFCVVQGKWRMVLSA